MAFNVGVDENAVSKSFTGVARVNAELITSRLEFDAEFAFVVIGPMLVLFFSCYSLIETISALKPFQSETEMHLYKSSINFINPINF